MKFKFVLASLAILASFGANAADGCKFLLCISGPWHSIGECRPTVYEVFRDLAKGRSFPTCAMSSGGAHSAWNAWSNEATCPIMYREYRGYEGAYSGCRYPGQISVQMNGQPWSTVYWDFAGNTTTQWSDAARASLSQQGAAPLDESFKADIGTWNAYRVSQCSSAGGTLSFTGYGAAENCNYPYSRGD